MNKKRLLANIKYYISVPVLYSAVFFLSSFIFRHSSLAENLGGLLVIIYSLVFVITPATVFVLMRFSLIRCYIDPIAAAEIPIFIYLAMIISKTNGGHTLLVSFNTVNEDLLDSSLIPLIVLFAFGLLSSFSIKRVKGDNLPVEIYFIIRKRR